MITLAAQRVHFLFLQKEFEIKYSTALNWLNKFVFYHTEARRVSLYYMENSSITG